MPSNDRTNGRTGRRPARENEGAERTSAAAGGQDRTSIVPVLLASGWIIVCAVQYVGADQRMRLILGEPVPLPGLALVDLTVLYVLLLVGTVIYATLRALRGRKDTATP